MKWPNFTLRSLLFAILILAGGTVLLQQFNKIARLEGVLAAHHLAESGNFAPDQFRVTVNQLVANQPLVYEVVIETIGAADITTDSPTNQAFLQGNATTDPAQLVRSSVLVVADRIDWLDGPNVAYRLQMQVKSSNGGSVGGPQGHTLPRETKFDDVFKLLIKPGVYPRNKPLPLIEFNGERSELLVK